MSHKRKFIGETPAQAKIYPTVADVPAGPADPGVDIQLHGLDEGGKQVDATFSFGGVTHTRKVNACFNAQGAYDEAETQKRLVEVSRGVRNKIEIGVITNPPPAPEPEATEESEA
jgi:hypothetical protein